MTAGDKLQEVLRQLTEKIIRIAEHCIECDVDVIIWPGIFAPQKRDALRRDVAPFLL